MLCLGAGLAARTAGQPLWGPLHADDPFLRAALAPKHRERGLRFQEPRFWQTSQADGPLPSGWGSQPWPHAWPAWGPLGSRDHLCFFRSSLALCVRSVGCRDLACFWAGVPQGPRALSLRVAVSQRRSHAQETVIENRERPFSPASYGSEYRDPSHKPERFAHRPHRSLFASQREGPAFRPVMGFDAGCPLQGGAWQLGHPVGSWRGWALRRGCPVLLLPGRPHGAPRGAARGSGPVSPTERRWSLTLRLSFPQKWRWLARSAACKCEAECGLGPSGTLQLE